MSSSAPPPATKTAAIERLQALYGSEDKADALTALGSKLNLEDSSPVWTQIADALEYRKNNYASAKAAMDQLSAAPTAATQLAEKMHALQGRFIAMFAAERIKAATYHYYGHGKEMSKDPGDFVAPILKDNPLRHLMTETVNALGAAHDIVQGRVPPANEKASAAIFIQETQKAIDILLVESKADLSAADVTALRDYQQKGVPFLAEECITNATYLLFNSGKRDFDNILAQVDAACRASANAQLMPVLDPMIAGMKMAAALADTRRSEMKMVLARQELLKSVPAEKIRGLEVVLQASGLLEEKQTIAFLREQQNQEKLMQIEGFLLRLGQNLRMTTENAIRFGAPNEAAAAVARQQLISDIRQDKDVTIEMKTHVQPFLDVISGGKGEAAFASDLGHADRAELFPEAQAAGLAAMMNADTLDLDGWEGHATCLTNFQENFSKAELHDQQAMAGILYFVAAKAPGHLIGQETYEAMVQYETQLFQDNPQSDKLNNLSGELNEIEAANLSHGLIVCDRPALDRLTLDLPINSAEVRSVFQAPDADYSAPAVEPLNVAIQQKLDSLNGVQSDVAVKPRGPSGTL